MQDEIIISNSIDLMHVSAADIMCIIADRNYSTIVLNDDTEHLVSFQLIELEKIISTQLGLNASIFIRVGKSIVINKDYLFTISIKKQEFKLRSNLGKIRKHNPSKEALNSLKKFMDSQLENKIKKS